jgi:hypothetical protein
LKMANNSAVLKDDWRFTDDVGSARIGYHGGRAQDFGVRGIAADRQGARGPQRVEIIARHTSELSNRKIVEALYE